MSGPVQVLVVGFAEPSLDGPAFDGAVLAELQRLKEAGVVRLVDLLVVRHTEDGKLETLDVAGFGGASAELFGGPEADEAGGPVWSLGDAVAPGSVAAVALIEHLWAGPLVAAIRAAGGTTLDETWLAPADVARLEGLLGTSPAPAP